MRRKLVAGNWKMHGSRSMASALVGEIAAALPAAADVLVFPPFPYIAELAAAHGGNGIGFGAQDVSAHEGQGAYTGEVSAAMLADVGAQWVLVGHSERRQYHAESDALVAEKFAAARAGGLTPVLCVGETLEEREAGQTEAVIARQLGAVLARNGIASFDTAVIAYEPVWAIGTGRTATPAQAQEAHAFIRSQLAKEDAMIAGLTRLLYGGSVKPANAAELFAQPDVDGGLIGGASLAAADFLAICASAQQ
ncbi:triose-phosphate isomerase [Fulvimonas soli]|uniref:Triosephosphate isomerase n=1 Tax=Fulvimonas soli TaxID=155197 RepID=A0A316IHR5_9GAMM|nr:triose-phosphate isomerase [Fulvimonas soli]PWK89784.1 triosephosphate isomerase [Fulvimonas soli]TNY27575.1 triose-phosphate isomerase [Fulvimonas soli]